MSESCGFVANSSNHNYVNFNYPTWTEEILCLICGAHYTNLGQTHPLVKVEPVEPVVREDEVLGKVVDNQRVDGDDVSKFKSGLWWSDEEQQLFHWFSKWFTLKLKGVQWSFNDESFPFCTVCKNQLIFLLDLRRKIEELEEALRNGLEELKIKVNASEGEFQLSGVYQRDSRYSSVRRQVSENNIWLGSAFKDISSLLPFVRLSVKDKTTAEKQLNTRKLKAQRTLKPTRGRGRPRSSSKNIPTLTKRKSKTPVCKTEVIESKPDVSKVLQTVKPKRGRPKKRLESSPPVENLNFLSNDDSTDSFKISRRNKTGEDEDYVPLEVDFEAHHQSDFEDSGNSNDDDFDIDIPENTSKPRPMDVGKAPEGTSQLSVADPVSDKIAGETSNVTENPVKIKRKVGRPRKPIVYKPDSDSGESDFEVHKHIVKAEEILDDAKLHKTTRRTGKGIKRVKIDPKTGIITCLKVKFTPLENGLYSCAKCSEPVKKNAAYQTNLFREHVLRVHSNRTVCPKCGYRAINVASLDTHINRVHKGIIIPYRRNHTCEICGKNQSNRIRLYRHRWNRHYTEEDKAAALARGEAPPPPNRREPKIQCDDCGVLIIQSNMAAHKLIKHGTEEEQAKAKVLCTVCGKRVYQFSMSNHMYQAHPEVVGVPTHTCGECGKVFKFITAYKKHLKVHQGLEFKCPLCGKEFRTNSSYTGHMNLHNDVRPYPCGGCPLAFASAKIRAKHYKHYHAAGSAPKRAPFLRGLEKRNRVDISSISKVESEMEVNKIEESNSN